MDTKSLARSKRAHSQHLNKKHHPNPNPKSKQTATSVPSESNPKKPSSGKQPGQNPHKPLASSSRLPSNWDRYEDELDPSSDAVPADQSKTSDVVLPKSKGADYGWLISEARSQTEYRSSAATVGGFSSLDDGLPDIFQQGLCSMLTVRGNSMLSWAGNDNFIVDDRSVTGDEASFLSLDLHAVASKLEKLDRSRRLFIEEDILPSQLDMNKSKETIHPEPDQSESCASGADEQFLDKSASLEHSYEKIIHHNTVLTPSNATSNYNSLPTQQVKDDSIQIEHFTLEEEVDSISQINLNDTKTSKDERSSKFEASAAEAELDMLLNSFGETTLDSPSENKKSIVTLPTSQWDDSPILPKGGFVKQPSEQGFNSSKSALMNFDLDDTIDDLLRETSNIKIPNNTVHPKGIVTSQFTPTSSANPTAGLDDFDAWLDTI